MKIEDIEIIVQANVKNAMKDIKKACKDAESQISSIQKAVDKVDTKSIQDSFSKTSDDIKSNIDDVKVYIHDLFNGLDTKEIDQVKEKFKEVIVETNGQIGVLMGSLNDVEKYIEEIFNSKQEIEVDDSSLDEIKEDLKEIQNSQPSGDVSTPKVTLPDTEALKDVEPTNLVNAWKVAIGGILTEIPKLSEAYDKAINSINASGIVDKFAGVKEQISAKLSGIKVKIDESKPVTAIKNIGDKIGELRGKLSNIKNYVSIPFDYMKEKAGNAINSVKEKVKGIGDKFSKPLNAVKRFASGIGDAVKKLKGMKGASSSLNGVEKAFKKGLSSIKMFVGGLLGVRGAYRAISRAASAYLSFDSELQDSFTNSWNTLGSLLAPALEFVANLFAKLTSYVASFVQALTGINLVAKANAKALKSQAKATKEVGSASKSLASIDDITNISSSSGGESGSDTPQISVQDVDNSMFDGLLDGIEKIKERLLLLFEPIKKSWNKYGAGLISSIKKSFNEIIKLCENFYISFESVWTNGTGETYMDNLFIKFTTIFDIIGHIAEAWSTAWGENNAGAEFIQSIMDSLTALQDFAIAILTSIDEVVSNGTLATTISLILSICTTIFNIIGDISKAFTDAWTNAGNGTAIIQNIADVFNIILDFGKSIMDTIEKWVVSEEFQNALNFVFELIKDITGAVKVVAQWVLDMWNKYVKPILDEKIMPLLGDLTDAIKAIWNVAKPVIEEIWKYIQRYIEPIIKNVTNAIGGIIDVVRGVLKFITGVFTGDWKKAWEGVKMVFKGIWDTLSNIIKVPLNMILGGIENTVNAIIKGFNFIKKSLNKISFDIPDWVPVIGGETWGFNFKMSDDVKLPRLATGNVAKEPTLAMFGEYANARTNPEITSPVSILKDAFRDVLLEYQSDGSRIDKLVINVAGENFFEECIDYMNEKTTRRGVSVVKESF